MGRVVCRFHRTGKASRSGGDIVQVERREATADDVICVQMAGSHLFGYRSANTLHRLAGPDVQLNGNEHVVGVVTAVIDRDLTKPRR
jgi:hypothetical protein